MGTSLKKGSKLIEKGKVFIIFKVEILEYGEGQRRIIHYKPHFDSNTDNCLICSIPEESLVEANLREPLSKKEIDNVFAFLSTTKKVDTTTDTNDAKVTLNLNDPLKTAGVIIAFWLEKLEKEQSGEGFSSSKKHVLGLAISRLVEEIALVRNISPKTAERKLEKLLADID